jgi:glycosyltransferase involved in cell wall biosynthesis
MAVPLTVASGTRYKLLEAFASRLPVVGTELAAEGLDAEDGVHYLRAEDPDACAAAILRTWSDRALRRRITDAAHELVKARYSYESSRRAVAVTVSAMSRRSDRPGDP